MMLASMAEREQIRAFRAQNYEKYMKLASY
jgi:hypothetical protein